MVCNVILRKILPVLTGVLLFSLVSCSWANKSNLEQEVPLVTEVLEDNTSPFYANYSQYPTELNSLPIGMFDSGTGGLTVMEQFLALDSFNNLSGKEEPDGIPDFDGEEFVYLADQANMPYGVYDSEGKKDFLRELIIKDALFLTSDPNRAKIVVIACNTATAYGLADVQALLEKSKTGVKAIGVIDAGVDGAMSPISAEEKSFAVGVLATVGTISSGGYQNSIKSYAANNGYKGDLRVVSQGGLGFAEAVDSEPDYISTSAKQVRSLYRGPRYGERDGIRPELLPLYNFDYSGNALLVKKDADGSILDIQLNSIGNYARFHLVTLLAKHREENPGVKMKSIILGCTHYPYLYDTLVRVIDELRIYKEEGVNIFDNLIDSEMFFVDPAVNTAKEAFKQLYAAKILRRSGAGNNLHGYISIPHCDLPESAKDSIGNLSYDFKYGRELGSQTPSVSVVPFSIDNINSENLMRIKERLPLSYSLIKKNLE